MQQSGHMRVMSPDCNRTKHQKLFILTTPNIFYMKGKAIRTICIILILLLSLCQIIPVNVSAVGDPVVELRWDDGQDLQYADVSPG